LLGKEKAPASERKAPVGADSVGDALALFVGADLVGDPLALVGADLVGDPAAAGQVASSAIAAKVGSHQSFSE
jgi:hypothetical protein